MSRVRALGCVVCKQFHDEETPAEIHHVDGKTKEGAHFMVLPLCYIHHRAGISVPAAVSRHPYKADFEARYGTEEELLELVARMLDGTEDPGFDPFEF